jgi:serine protease Do
MSFRRFSMQAFLNATSLLALTTFPLYSIEKSPDFTQNCRRCSPFVSVAKKCIPSVVFVRCESAAEDEGPFQGAPFNNFGNDFFERFFGFPPRNQPRQPQMSQGSGFFVSQDGYIMTNCHVIEKADKITVVLEGDRELDATLVGADPHTDIAILKVEGTDFPYLELGDSDKIEIGEDVAAIGSPFQLQASLTSGVISAKGRQNLRITDLEDFIQTDAAINPGNSGGPLINLDSEVIGINTAIVSRSGGYMGIGFAVPSNMAKNIMAQIIDKGSVTRGFLGVALQPIDREMADAFHLEKVEGALVSEVIKDSPAEKAGIKQGDIILEYNGVPIKSLGSFRNEISLMNPNTSLEFKINRKGTILMIPVTLGVASDTLAVPGGIVQKLGVEIEALTPDLRNQLGYTKGEEGVVITKVKPGSPAALAGLRPGFLVQAVNHKKVTTIAEFNEAISDPTSQNRVLILIKHGTISKFYSIKLS